MAFIPETEHPFPHRFNGHGKFGNGNGNGKGFFGKIEKSINKLSTTQLVLLAAGGVLVVDHFVAPKGKSFVSKAIDKVTGSKALPPPPPAPLPLPSAVAKGYWAGANKQAGWNRGMDPYGPWAVANPMVQYAHAAQNWQPMFRNEAAFYPWEE